MHRATAALRRFCVAARSTQPSTSSLALMPTLTPACPPHQPILKGAYRFARKQPFFCFALPFLPAPRTSLHGCTSMPHPVPHAASHFQSCAPHLPAPPACQHLPAPPAWPPHLPAPPACPLTPTSPHSPASDPLLPAPPVRPPRQPALPACLPRVRLLLATYLGNSLHPICRTDSLHGSHGLPEHAPA